MQGSLGEKIGEGVFAEVHAWAPGQVVKLSKPGIPQWVLQHEKQMTRAVWAASGEDRAGHLLLVLEDPLRDTWLGQLDDLTGRPGMDLREDAFADLLSQRSLHARSPPCRGLH